MAGRAPLMLTHDLQDGRTWRRETLIPRDWLVALSPRCVDELDEVVRRVRRDPLPTLLLSPDQFALPACGELMDARPRQALPAASGWPWWIGCPWSDTSRRRTGCCAGS